MPSFDNSAVAAAFAAYPASVRPKLHALRKLVFETAKRTEGVGRLEETLKWSEPAYLTPETKTGTTIRIDWKDSEPDVYAMYFHCQTSLLESFRARYPDTFTYDGNRRIVFGLDEEVDQEALSWCISAALTYHSQKKKRR